MAVQKWLKKVTSPYCPVASCHVTWNQPNCQEKLESVRGHVDIWRTLFVSATEESRSEIENDKIKTISEGTG